jgi:hypothetical protein
METPQPEEMVLIYEAPDQTTAELVCATLEASGLSAVVAHTTEGPASGLLPYLGLGWSRSVSVPASQVEAARAVLQANPPPEAELIAEEEADPVTLEEAEARVREM